MDCNEPRRSSRALLRALLRCCCALQMMHRPAPVTPFEHKATGFERFMLKTKSVPDGTAEEWLQDKGKLARFEGDKRRWPLKLQTAWNMMGVPEQIECHEAVVPVAYCTNPKCQRRITPEEERCSHVCSKCATPWFSRLDSGKPNVLSFDYFIQPEWSYAQMLALPEFSDALIEFWPRALEMMSQDPEDLTVAVDDVLSGTNARRFYRSRRNDIKFDLKPGRSWRVRHSHLR